MDQRIRFGIIDELHLFRIELQVLVGPMRDLAEVNQGAGVEAVLFVKRKLLVLANGLMEVANLRLGLGKFFQLLSEAFHVGFETAHDLTFASFDERSALVLVRTIKNDLRSVFVGICDVVSDIETTYKLNSKVYIRIFYSMELYNF